MRLSVDDVNLGIRSQQYELIQPLGEVLRDALAALDANWPPDPGRLARLRDIAGARPRGAPLRRPLRRTPRPAAP
jgi:hypothetical protein